MNAQWLDVKALEHPHLRHLKAAQGWLAPLPVKLSLLSIAALFLAGHALSADLGGMLKALLHVD